MNAEDFLKTKGIGKPTIKAVRLPHKYKNIELELIPLMEEYAELKLLGIADVVRSVFTIHSTEDECIIKIVGTEDEAKKQVEDFKKQHNYADFFYEKQNIS
jgi:hypothetical protein